MPNPTASATCPGLSSRCAAGSGRSDQSNEQRAICLAHLPVMTLPASPRQGHTGTSRAVRQGHKKATVSAGLRPDGSYRVVGFPLWCVLHISPHRTTSTLEECLQEGSNIENPNEMTLMTLSKPRPLVCLAMERGMSTERGARWAQRRRSGSAPRRPRRAD